MDSPTVFVVPPNAAIKCPLHGGVFVDPQCAPCGCTFCKSCIENVIDTSGKCPTHNVPLIKDQIRPNINAKGVVDDLLIYCKGGLQKNSKGDWAPCSAGCNMWITLGKRKDHESTCPHANTIKEDDFVNIPSPYSLSTEASSSEVVSPLTVPCVHADRGCLFIGHSDQDLAFHLAACGYVHMTHQIRALHDQISSRDLEIARLNEIISQMSHSNDFHIRELAQQIFATVGGKFERIDENSQRVIDEAGLMMLKTKAAVQNSPAYQQSLSAFSNIRLALEQVMEQARLEIIAKREELADKITRIINKPPFQTPPTSPFPPSGSDDVSTTTTSSVASAPVEELPVEGEQKSAEEERKEEVAVSEPAPVVVPDPVPEAEEHDDDVDEEIRAFLDVSKEFYKREQEAREAEEAQIQQALKLSMLDAASQTGKQ